MQHHIYYEENELYPSQNQYNKSNEEGMPVLGHNLIATVNNLIFRATKEKREERREEKRGEERRGEEKRREEKRREEKRREEKRREEKRRDRSKKE
ncbi:hypothetical protein HGM15179_009692 [Zosterops borbonicus]|uniref:Uncharacterized protein n=1 Tax=Zosterops borbonicus TaxID=364589 RepID=A0A8K1GG40_9PASS|nr:hypothetical protein HGM15179_009692 [Zosterops borbonicus]